VPDLTFQVEGAEVVANAAAPLLAFKLRLTDANPEQMIHTVALRCQIQHRLFQFLQRDSSAMWLC
jgi:hypothetical protein